MIFDEMPGMQVLLPAENKPRTSIKEFSDNTQYWYL